MKDKAYEKIYEWNELVKLFKEFMPELVKMQNNIREHDIVKDLPLETKNELKTVGFSDEGRDPKEVTRELIDSVYPYRMKTNHPRYFCFIPNDISPYSIFGEFLNSIHNPYGGGFSISGGTSALENETMVYSTNCRYRCHEKSN